MTGEESIDYLVQVLNCQTNLIAIDRTFTAICPSSPSPLTNRNLCVSAPVSSGKRIYSHTIAITIAVSLINQLSNLSSFSKTAKPQSNVTGNPIQLSTSSGENKMLMSAQLVL